MESYGGELQLNLQLELDQRDALRRLLIRRRQGRFAAPVGIRLPSSAYALSLDRKFHAPRSRRSAGGRGGR